MLFFRLTPHALSELRDESDHALRCAPGCRGLVGRRVAPAHATPNIHTVGFRRRDSTGLYASSASLPRFVPHPAPLQRDSRHPHSHPALPRLGGFVSTGRDCPARVAPMSRREAQRPDGPGSRARRAERQSSTARRAAYAGLDRYSCSRSPSSPAAARRCALGAPTLWLHSAPHLRRESTASPGLTKFTARGEGAQDSLTKSPQKACGAPLATLGLFLSDWKKREHACVALPINTYLLRENTRCSCLVHFTVPVRGRLPSR